MVMTSLLLADELSERTDELEKFKVENNATVRERKEEALADKLDKLALRITEIADSMSDEDIIVEEEPVEENVEEDQQET